MKYSISYIITCIRKITLPSLLFLLSGCTYSYYNIHKIDESGTINPIPIRVIENSKAGDCNISAAITLNNKRKIEYLNYARDTNRIELPQKLFNIDFDYQVTNRASVFFGSQIYSNNNFIDIPYYLGIGFHRKYKKWGIRTDLFYYHHKNSYTTTIFLFERDNTSGDFISTDSLLIQNTSTYNNILTSITINLYKINLLMNLSETPYYYDNIPGGTLEIGGETKYTNTAISRRIHSIWSIGYYKEINNLSTIFGISWLPGYKDDLYKYFIQFTMNLN